MSTIILNIASENFLNKNLVTNSNFFVDNTDNTKKIGFDTSSNNTGTTLTLLSSTTANRMITLPDATGTVTLGPTSTTNGHIASFNGTTGILQDSGILTSNLPLLNTLNTFTNTNIFPNIQSSLYYGNSATPSIGAGPGAGTGGTASISGNDTCGIIAVTFGTAPAPGLSVIAQITMNNSSTTHPIPIICFQSPTTTVVDLPTTITAAWVNSNSWAIFNWGVAGITGFGELTWNYIVYSL
jgi:hypothetical protein